MKLLVLLMVLMPTLAMAYPALGDFVRYEAKFEDSKIIYERKILSHDEASDSFEVRSLILFKDQILRDVTHILPRNFLYTPSKVENVLKTCFEREGVITNLVISGKKISVCEFYHEDSQLTYMIGPVPFGQVRFQEYQGDGIFLDFNLTYFSSISL